MAVLPNIFLNGTTADAIPVNENFTEIYTDIDQTNVAAGNKTGSGKFVLQNSPLLITPHIDGAGAGDAILQYSNSATSRTLTVPDPGSDDVFMTRKVPIVDGPGVGFATLAYANTASSRILTIPDPGANDTFVTNLTLPTIAFDPKISGAGAGVATLQYANSASNRTVTIPDPGAAADFLMTAGSQTITGAKTFSGANTLLVPTNAPTVNQSMALVSGILQVNDGTSAKSYLRTDTFNSSTYITSIINLGLANDVVWVDVDATNAAITFTVGVAGQYMVMFQFGVFLESNFGATYDAQTAFRLLAGATASAGQAIGFAGTSTGFDVLQQIVTFVHVFNLSAGSNTVKLQKTNVTSTNISGRFITGGAFAAGGNDGIYKVAYRIGDA